jgi:hypothetical protein
MQPVGFGIMDVVEAIYSAGGKAEGEEGQHGWGHIAPFCGVTAKEQGREHEGILQALVWANQADDVSTHVSS